MGNSNSKLTTRSTIAKIMYLTPLLYPTNMGFTKWNYLNMIISSGNNHNKNVNKFLAMNSASILFASLIFYTTNNNNFYHWLKKDNINHFFEKIGHIGPFLYYYYNGYYYYSDNKISWLSFLYIILWSSRCGNSLFNKDDLYYKVKYHITWHLVWLSMFYGSFFTVDKNTTSELLTKLRSLPKLLQNSP